MATGSTKQRGRKREDVWGAQKSAETASDIRAGEPDAPADIHEGAWLFGFIFILALAAFLRLYAPELKPLHHDEGVNGFFLTNLVKQGVYKYDPQNYHGPTLYYLTLPTVALFGLTTFALRLVTALSGVGIVWLVLCLRRRLGSVGALAAATFVAVSPAAVYYARYYIHETPFVFFTLGVVVAALRFYETGKGWYLMLASASAAMLFATKETAFISLGTLGLAWLVARVWARLTAKLHDEPLLSARERKRLRQAGRPREEEAGFLARVGGKERAATLALFAAALFLFVNVLFYSSFFTNWKGVGDALRALAIWKNTGTSAFHEKPWHTYLNWLLKEEAPVLLLAAAGSLVALLEQRKNRFAVFAGAWGFGILAAYSLIPYKTPWLVLSFVVPLALAAGYAVQWLVSIKTLGRHAYKAAFAVVVVAAGVGLYQSWVVNFREYDNDAYPYVYSHTQRGAHELVAEIERLAERSGKGKETGISVASPEYWPLPWYLRDYKGVGYSGSISARYDPQATPLVIGRQSENAAEDQTQKLRPALGGEYQPVGTYALRPGVRLTLYARRDLAGQ